MADTKKKTTKSGAGKTNKSNKSTTRSKTGSQKSTERQVKDVPVKEKYVPSEKELKLRNEIKLLVALAVTVLVELSCFGFLSPLGDYLAYFIFGCFGLIGYALPVIVFFGLAFLISNQYNRGAVIKFSAGSVLVFLISAMMYVITVGESIHGVGYYYRVSGTGKNGGGFFGSLIGGALCNGIGLVGTYIVLILLIIVCLIIITERSFISGVQKSSKKIYDTAVNDAQIIKETAKNHNKEKNYQKNKRINKKVKGVNLAKLDDPEKQDEDIHEITDKIPVNASIRRGRVDIEEISEVKESAVYEPKEPVMEDEEGFFVPKERIDVRESARAVMNRPLYGGLVSGADKASDTKQSVNNISAEALIPSDSKGQENSEAGNSSQQKTEKKKTYVLPKTTLLNKGTGSSAVNERELMATAVLLKDILKNFGVNVEVTEYHKGPSVTRYEVQPEIGTRLSKITALADDIKLNLAATDIRIEPIPGKSTIGIEVPNKKRESVLIRDLIESAELNNNKSKIAFAAGMDIAGNVVVGDIAKMPHMLVAGTTGSGKSVFTNSIIQSILFRATPDEVRLIIVDPKVVEFGVYNGIPHLLQPVVTDPRQAANTLKWAVKEMSDRYKKFADINVRDLKGYNEKQKNIQDRMPQIVIVIDELADLMMVAAKDVEEAICRLAQLARAAGIHLIIATQRPSVDVVTGLIKANIPSRVALSVSSGTDSRTIIDSVGAEKLLGNGDMLFYPSGYVKPVRLQGAFVSDAEVQRVVEFWKAQAFPDMYDENLTSFVETQISNEDDEEVDESGDARDEYFMEAARLCIEKQKASTSMLQRMYRIGFNRASRIIDQLEAAGVIGAEEGTKPRKVLMTMAELEQLFNQ